MDRTFEWCWHLWEPTLGVYDKDYISGKILVKYVCFLCGSSKYVWR